MVGKLLVVDDDVSSCRLMQAIFGAEGFEVMSAHDGESGLRAIEEHQPDVVALDIQLPGLGGIEVLERLGSQLETLPVVMLTAHRDVKHAVRAMQLGAYDYLTKPIDVEEVVLVFKRALESRALRSEVYELRRRVEGGVLAAQMGPSAQVVELVDQVHTVASTDFTVLLLGETGTGKELVAHALHRESDRATKPFIAIDCGAIPDALLESELFGHEKGAFSGADRRKEGQFQLAEGGTLFLDEIGNMPLALQAKLLRALESKQVQPVGATRTTAMDVRFVAATNVDLQARVAAGEFRADLYFRLAQYTIRLPALRERTADIAYLAKRFLIEASVELRKPIADLAPPAIAMLRECAWSGNVRELRNVVRQAVLRTSGTMVDESTLRTILGTSARTSAPSVDLHIEGRSLREIADAAAHEAERAAIREALRAAGGNKTQAARALKTDFKTLHVKMKQLGISTGAD